MDFSAAIAMIRRLPRSSFILRFAPLLGAALLLVLSTEPAHPWEQPAPAPLWNGTAYNDAVPATGADKLHALGITGKGLTTAILDSDFDLSHEIFKNVNVVNGYTYPPGSYAAHGTHVAGIALSMAPDSNLWLEKYPETLDDVLVAKKFRNVLDDAEQYGIAAVNASWGDGLQGGYADPEDVASTTPLTAEVVRQLLAGGVAVVAASGNAAMNDRVSYPDGLPGVVSAGALDQYGYLSSLTTAYDKPGLFLLAPGINVYSSIAAPDGYMAEFGTSFAAPHVTGAITLLKSGARAASTEEITAALYDSAARVAYDPDEWIDGWNIPDQIRPNPGSAWYYINLFQGNGAPLTLYTAWLNAIQEKFENNNVTAEEWRILNRILSVAYQVGTDYNNASSTYTTTDGKRLYGDALFVKILEMTGGFTPLEHTEYGFIQVDAAYRLLTSRRSLFMAESAALSGSTHAGALTAFSREMGAYLDQNLVDLFQRLDGQPAGVLARAARQLGPAWAASTLRSAAFGILDLHNAAARRLARFRDRPDIPSEAPSAAAQEETPSGVNHWSEGFGAYQRRGETRNAGSYHGSFAGIMAGMEKDYGDALIGGFAAWANHDIDGDGSSRGNWGTLGLYGGLYREAFSAGLSLAAGMGEYSLTRTVDGPAASLIGMNYAPIRVSAKSDPRAFSLSARASAEWRLLDRGGWSLSPGIEGAFIHSAMKGFRERGGGGVDLSVRRYAENYAEGGAGLRVSKTFFREGRPHVALSAKAAGLYGESFGDSMRASFQGAGSSFSVEPEKIKSWWCVPEATLSWQATDRLAVSASYQGRFGQHTESHAGYASITLNW